MWSTIQLSTHKIWGIIYMGKSNEFIENAVKCFKSIYNHNNYYQIFYLISSALQGDYFRLGHGSDQHIRKPTTIQGLRGKKVVHVAVGALHCLAVTDNGECFAWGDNDHGKYYQNKRNKKTTIGNLFSEIQVNKELEQRLSIRSHALLLD